MPQLAITALLAALQAGSRCAVLQCCIPWMHVNAAAWGVHVMSAAGLQTTSCGPLLTLLLAKRAHACCTAGWAAVQLLQPVSPCTLRCSFTDHELAEIDQEGRCVCTDHGCFVVFNLYVPAITTEDKAAERFAFKLRLLEVSSCAELPCHSSRPTASCTRRQSAHCPQAVLLGHDACLGSSTWCDA